MEKYNTLKLLLEKIINFRKERDWEQFHNPKNLAISISLEAAELLEKFQWLNLEESLEFASKNKDKISDELADLLIYIFYLCNDLEIDLIDSIEKKIAENKKKIPCR